MQQPSDKRSTPDQARRNQRPIDDDIDMQDEMDDMDDRDDMGDEELEELEEPVELPANGLPFAVISGVTGGVLSVILNIILTFLNVPAFQRYASEGSNVSYTSALALVGLQCLNFFVSLLICGGAGYLVGRRVVQRHLGFYAGAIAGAIIYLASFLVRYIPNYPGNLSNNAGSSAGRVAITLLLALVFLCVWGLIGGLAGFFGARLATRRHPYYDNQAS